MKKTLGIILSSISAFCFAEPSYQLITENDASYILYQDGKTQCRSAALPPEEQFGTGASTLTLSHDSPKTLKLEYASTSGHFGMESSMIIAKADCHFSVSKMVNHYLYDPGTYIEHYHFADKTYRTEHQGRELSSGSILGSDTRQSINHAIYGNASASDLSGQVTITHQEDTLSFSIDVTDDTIVFGEGIHSDHIEIWYATVVHDPKPITSLKEQEHNVRQWLINIIDDRIILSFGYPESVERIMLPGSVTMTENGYSVQFSLSTQNMIPRPLSDNALLNMSIVISDADEDKKQSTMIATSKLKYGNPSSFGRVLLTRTPLPRASETLLIK